MEKKCLVLLLFLVSSVDGNSKQSNFSNCRYIPSEMRIVNFSDRNCQRSLCEARILCSGANIVDAEIEVVCQIVNGNCPLSATDCLEDKSVSSSKPVGRSEFSSKIDSTGGATRE